MGTLIVVVVFVLFFLAWDRLRSFFPPPPQCESRSDGRRCELRDGHLPKLSHRATEPGRRRTAGDRGTRGTVYGW